MHYPKNSKEKKIIIEADLLVPLEELPMIALAQDVDVSSITDTLIKNPRKINRMMKNATEEELSEDNPEVKIKKMEFSYNDSSNITHAIAYFKTKLEGPEKAIRTIAGLDKLFFYDWSKNDSETKN